jgi:hypothetical protein
MDDLLQLLINFMGQIENNFDQLNDAEAEEISEFLIETMTFMMETQKRVPESLEQATPEVPQGVELLWILSGEQPNAFVDYLRTYPGEGLKELANNPAQLAQVMQRMQSEHPSEPLGVDASGIEDTQFPSSNVSGMKYDQNSGKLLVKFHGDNGEPVYQYNGVPPQIFQLLQHGNAFATTKGKNKWGEWWPMKNPSIGAALNQWIKKAGYPYQRLS